jgi:uncharacterized membrane protein YciS (DUF1049 family)
VQQHPTTTLPLNTGAGILSVILIALTIVAITDAPRKKKLLTFFFILGWAAAGFGLGTAIGLVLGSAGAAGGLAGLCVQIMGIAAAVNRMRLNKKLKALSAQSVARENEEPEQRK